MTMNLKELSLSKGKHSSPFDEEGNATMCVQEFVSWMTGEDFTDQPDCVSPVLRRFTIALNDAWDDEMRQKLRPYAVRMIGTADDGQDERRAWLAVDWIVRTHLPAFLRLAELTEHAEKLEALPEIESEDDLKATESVRDSAVAAAWAAGAAARAAGGVARAAARAAWDAAEAAARAAAYSGVDLRPTVDMLQDSALDLLDRMIDPARMHDLAMDERIELETEYLRTFQRVQERG